RSSWLWCGGAASRATSPARTTSRSKRPRGTGTSSTWCGWRCSCSSTWCSGRPGAAGRFVNAANAARALAALFRLPADPVRRDPAHPDRQQHDQDQRHRQRDAPGQGIDGALGRPLVDHHVVQGGAEVPQDDQQKSDDQQDFHGVIHQRLLGRMARPFIIAAAGPARVSRRATLVFGWTLAVAAIVLFCILGTWQYGRKDQKQAMLDQAGQVLERRDAQPLAAASSPDAADGYAWAAGDGAWATAPAVLLDNQ